MAVQTVPMSLDYQAWDNTESVTFTSHARAFDTAYGLTNCVRRAPTWKELAASGGVYSAIDVVWLLPAALVTAAGATGTKRPKPADTITDSDGTVYTVLAADYQATRSTWRLITRDMVIAYDLQDTLTLRRPTLATDAAAGRTYSTYTTISSGIACRFQETEASTQDERGKRVTVKRYSVWVATRLYPTIEDQVLDQDSNVYEVRGWRDADRIDQLQMLDCERRGW